MNRILIVDDEPRIRGLIRKYAEFEGYDVTEAESGMQAVELCKERPFDVVIMDVMMPELDGFSAVKEIRRENGIPVIMLSARGEEYDRIHGFESGADDYVVKPFSPKELMLRIEAVLRRTRGGETGVREVFTCQGLVVDFTARIVQVDGETVNLSPKEYELLFFLIKNKGVALPRDKILSEVWGYDFFGDDRTLDTHIKLLRKSLGLYSRCIVTIRGVGYRFDV